MEQEPTLSKQDQEKKHKFELLYQQQEEERQLQKKLKQQRDDEINDPKEKMLTIQKEFKEKHEQLVGQIKNFKIENLEIEQLFTNFQNLRNYFVATNYALTSFDKQQYKDQVDKVEKNLFILRDMVKPRKKFRFSKRIKQDNQQKVNQELIKRDNEVDQNQNSEYFDKVPGLQNLEGQILRPTAQEVSKSYKLFNLKNCEVYLDFVFENVYIKKIQNCKIFIGPTKSSVFVDFCQDSDLNLMGHQLRLHHCVNTNFNIFSSSKSIIEHCNKLKFSKYSYKYDNIENDIKESGFEKKENQWKDIQDFNWLKQEKSPNFEIIE